MIGVLAKLRGSIYEQRRSRSWWKIKCEKAQEFVVGGFTDPQGKRGGLGALLVGYHERLSESRQVGIAGGPAFQSEPSFSSPSGRGRVRVRSLAGGSSNNSEPDFVFAGKIGTSFTNELLLDLRAQLDALEIDKHNKLRHPRLLGVRYDKDPRDVVRE